MYSKNRSYHAVASPLLEFFSNNFSFDNYSQHLPLPSFLYRTAVLTKYHAACGNHCSAQRQSSSFPVFR